MMSNIEQMVTEMPRVDYPKGYGVWIEAQCRLLAEQGWRKVPSVDEISYQYTLLVSHGARVVAEELHRWLLEGE